ncbi:hypothetical protein HRbin10_00693 [bacterium HR10]|nr:hypothetical protein HRbin10_00693 [bacterium HR10]
MTLDVIFGAIAIGILAVIVTAAIRWHRGQRPAVLSILPDEDARPLDRAPSGPIGEMNPSPKKSL